MKCQGTICEPPRLPAWAQMPPLDIFFGEVGGAGCSYVPQPLVASLVKDGQASQWWRMLGKTVSVKLKGGGMVKRWESFAHHVRKGRDVFMGLMVDCDAIGVSHPSSYSDIFSQRFHSPSIPFSVNALLSPGFAGAWQAALHVGYTSGTLRKYDINTAYLWSLLHQGLPDERTFSFSQGYTNRNPGVFLMQSPGDKSLPYPFSVRNRFVLATQQEISAYDLPVRGIVYGITWTKSHDPDPIHQLIKTSPASKQVSQSYWGRWASSGRVECRTEKKKWGLRNPIRNLVWAHCILSAVRLKVWEHSRNAVHVYVDSVITTDELPIGTGPGEWKLQRKYEKGLLVFGPGMYGEPGSQLEKHSGFTFKGWDGQHGLDTTRGSAEARQAGRRGVLEA